MIRNIFYYLFIGLLLILFSYLVYWAIFILEDTDDKLTAFGITGVLLTGLITLVTFSLKGISKN